MLFVVVVAAAARVSVFFLYFFAVACVTNPHPARHTLHRLTVTPEELRKLFRRFKKLDTDGSGALSVQEFQAIPELEHNPLVTRVVTTIDSNKSGEVDFVEFIQVFLSLRMLGLFRPRVLLSAFPCFSLVAMV